MHVIGWIIVGALAGWIASQVVHSRSQGCMVNIALGLVEHAYFMEKGEMRFDGAAADLLARDDLLRAVFLEGSEAAT